jgi:hypothetical protein
MPSPSPQPQPLCHRNPSRSVTATPAAPSPQPQPPQAAQDRSPRRKPGDSGQIECRARFSGRHSAARHVSLGEQSSSLYDAISGTVTQPPQAAQDRSPRRKPGDSVQHECRARFSGRQNPAGFPTLRGFRRVGAIIAMARLGERERIRRANGVASKNSRGLSAPRPCALSLAPTPPPVLPVPVRSRLRGA